MADVISEDLYWFITDILELLDPDCPHDNDYRRMQVKLMREDLEKMKPEHDDG